MLEHKRDMGGVVSDQDDHTRHERVFGPNDVITCRVHHVLAAAALREHKRLTVRTVVPRARATVVA